MADSKADQYIKLGASQQDMGRALSCTGGAQTAWRIMRGSPHDEGRQHKPLHTLPSSAFTPLRRAEIPARVKSMPQRIRLQAYRIAEMAVPLEWHSMHKMLNFLPFW